MAVAGLRCRPCPKEAEEVCNDPEGRFFVCEMTASTIVIVEKKASPEHLQVLGCLDTPTPLGEVLLAMEDAGEAWASSKTSDSKSFTTKNNNQKINNKVVLNPVIHHSLR